LARSAGHRVRAVTGRISAVVWFQSVAVAVGIAQRLVLPCLVVAAVPVPDVLPRELVAAARASRK
jgi:hypothetical protein|tara:strand:+ start:1087 stop:1281 length:195 start_codon:yes stop_codon:yes gene_type:complete